MPTENSQIVDAVNVANTSALAHAPAMAMDLTYMSMADSIGIAMHNAVNTQHNAQTIGVAATTQVCALIIGAAAAAVA